MARTLLCEIVTPERIVYTNEVEMVVAPTIDGEIGIVLGVHLDRGRPSLVGEPADPDRPQSGGACAGEVLAGIVADVDGSGRLHLQEPARHAERDR